MNYAKYFDTFYPFQEDCSTYTHAKVVNSDFVQDLIAQFKEKCLDNPTCDISYDYTKLDEQCLE